MPNVQQTDVQAFIRDAGVETILTDLKKDIAAKEAGGKKFIVSDVYDDKNNQYVDLVQEGGGVWGVALLGFTYILEKMGVRFFSLAGTSAGAINTILLAGTKNKEEEKTETIIKEFLELEMFSFVDGKKDDDRLTSWVKRNIQNFVRRPNYFKKLRMTGLWLSGLVVGISVIAFIAGIILHHKWVVWISVAALVIWAIVAYILYLLLKKIRQLGRTGYGLNCGDVFHKWINDRLASNNIRTLEDLKTHFSKVPASLQVRPDEKRDIIKPGVVTPPGNPMLTIITSDITTGNKIEFPRMWDLYWAKKEDVNPADFVRASMSIPVFFETYTKKISPGITDVEKKWKDHLDWNGAIPAEVRFVDGGALSNFPINVFYNPNYIIPRMPTFGIRLGDSKGQRPNSLKNIFAYVGAIISTLRSSTDKDFINKNKAFTLAVTEVELKGHSWLNFFMEEDEKKTIFCKGASAAAAFLKNFDWEDYKSQRFDNNALLTKQRDNPNNW